MRKAALLIPVALAACSPSTSNVPSLAPRPAEAIDPRLPVAVAAPSSKPNADLAAQLSDLVAQAVAGDRAFQAAAESAERLVAAAGPRESESWVVAQQAVSVATAARAPVARAVADVDSLAVRRIAQTGGIQAADLRAIADAAEQVSEIDRREAATIDRFQERLAR